MNHEGNRGHEGGAWAFVSSGRVAGDGTLSRGRHRGDAGEGRSVRVRGVRGPRTEDWGPGQSARLEAARRANLKSLNSAP